MTQDSQPELTFSAGQALWNLTDELRRSSVHVGLDVLVAEAKKRGIPLSWETISALGPRLLRYGSGDVWLPPYVSKFIIAYLQNRRVGKAIDPFAGVGGLIVPIAASCDVEEAIGIVRDDQSIVVARAISDGLPIRWQVGAADAVLSRSGPFDLVVSNPPWGVPSTAREFPSASGLSTVKDSETNLYVIRSVIQLTDQGEAIFILPNSFFWSPALNAFPELGLTVRAVFALPARALATYPGIDLNIVVVGKGTASKWFVGQIDASTDPEPLIKNLREKKPGLMPELGRLIEPGTFTSWQALVIEEEIQKLVQRGGFRAVALSDVVSQINLGKRTDDGGFSDTPNCVYLPLIGTSPAVTSLAAIRIKPQNCAQLVVRPEAAFAEFVAGMFNSPLGRKIRSQLVRGAFIPKITKESLRTATVFLPLPETQRAVVDVHREIRDLTLRLDDLERNLWDRPVDAGKVRQVLGALNQKESFESWLETLPFPLASVLWRYHATATTEQKVAHLFNFFEACTVFLGTLILSAFHSDSQFFTENKDRWFDPEDKPHSLERSSFGEWVVRTQRLAKTTRQLLSDKDKRVFGLALFKTENVDAVEALCAKDVYASLEAANKYRIDWKGHGGIAGESEYARRLTLLEAELTRIHAALASTFENWWVIRPGKNEYSRGIYRFSAAKLLGSRQIFKEVEIQTSTVMDKNELYLVDTETRDPLQLLPFFRVMPSPRTEENACYFYNRVQKEGVRWVSYHFEQEAEIIRPDEALLKVISEIEKTRG